MTFGTRAVAALFALFDRAKLSGKPRALARETIAPDMVQLLDELAAKEFPPKEKKPRATAAELDEIWLCEMENDPAMRGVDVRGQLAAAQFWCKNNGRICTRRFMTTWLLNPKHRAVVNPGGPLGRPVVNGQTAPAGWLAKLNELFPDSVYAPGGIHEFTAETDRNYNQLPAEVRAKLQ